MKLCECGCGDQVKYPWHRFIYGHAVRCQSKETRKKQAESLRGFKHTKETKRRISEGNKGKHKGKIVSEKTRKKMSIAHKGRKYKIVTEETKRKMSLAQKGRNFSEKTRKKMSEAKKGRTGSRTGKKCSEETKLKISASNQNPSAETRRKMSESHSGELHYNWKGGISHELYCNKFNNALKEKIRNRDNRTCQYCGSKENGRKHAVHHIHYDKENCHPDLITLCIPCNIKSNYNRKQ